jgi:hypothetical protein
MSVVGGSVCMFFFSSNFAKICESIYKSFVFVYNCHSILLFFMRYMYSETSLSRTRRDQEKCSRYLGDRDIRFQSILVFFLNYDLMMLLLSHNIIWQLDTYMYVLI